MSIAAVVIGRNEGARLITCLEALAASTADPVIYVDSGSTDGSVEAAWARGAQVVALDMTRPFTAARARNEGLAQVPTECAYVQFLDGDCEMRAGWLETGAAFLDENPQVAVVCGRRRERYPERSVYNRLIDDEWDTALGQARACGGDALMRVTALRAVGGYTETLIAGEEPELCVRLRAAGWQVWRMDAEMTWHDAAITRFGQWWKRSKRAGHAFAEGAFLHGAPPERHWVTETRRALFWGAALPVWIVALGALTAGWGLLFALIYPVQVLRLSRAKSLPWAFYTTVAKFAEAQGAMQFFLGRLRGRGAKIIEYK